MQCASVTVTYNPDIPLLIAQIEALPSDWTKIIVDNGSAHDRQQRISAYIGNRSDVLLLRLGANKGLATAQNEGMRWLAKNTATTHVLLLDQDSEPAPDAAALLAEAHSNLERAGLRVGAVGPSLIDPLSGVSHQFHVINGPLWSRTDGEGQSTVRCAGLNGSGTFMKLALALELGGMDESLFIDLVDAEWSFRLIAQGNELHGIPGAMFKHRMGDRTRRLWLLGWRAWPDRTPLRHRYLFRNYVILLGRRYVPALWKCWAIAKITLTASVICVFGPERLIQLRCMAQGLSDGLHGRTGAIH